jgi:pantoate--beta-alanine ligase
MVQQLNLPVEMIFADTVRTHDGLALSSRNSYLSATERGEAPQLHAVIRAVADQLRRGRRDFGKIEVDAIATLVARGWQPDYVAVRRQSDLLAPEKTDRALVVLAAAKLGTTRLIDSLEISLES